MSSFSRRAAALACLAAVPALALAGSWTSEPEFVWLQDELQWSQPLHPQGLDIVQIEALYDPPPRAAWCGPEGQVRAPDPGECAAYDAALESWMLVFTDQNDPAGLPPYDAPPTWCGGC